MTLSEKPSGTGSEPPVKDDFTGVAERVKAVIALRDLKQNAVAREAGIASSALSKFLRGEYEGDNQAVSVKLTIWLDALSLRDRLPVSTTRTLEFVETPTARKIISALRYAHLTVDFALIAGVPGAGKTTALRHYRDVQTNAWLATMSPATEKPVAALSTIGFAIGLRSLGGGADKMFRAIVERLKGTAGILIIDEAQHLLPKALENIRSIGDEAEIGLAFVGDLALLEKFNAFGQLSSRIGKKEVITKTELNDVAALSTALGITGNAEREFLNKVSAQRGGLRCVVKVERQAQMYAAGEEKPLTLDHLVASWQNLNLGSIA
ncbi:MAG: AAA family ATPase [Rhodospirillaceae bacterium]